MKSPQRGTARSRRLRLAAVALALAWVAAPATAQQLSLRMARAPHYITIPVDIEVHSEGFERSPEPTCEAPAPSRGELRLRGISPNIESSVTIVNGRMTKTERVRFTCHFQFVSHEAGTFAIGPFEVQQGGTAIRSEPLRISIQEVPLDPRLKIRVRVPDRPAFIGQHVPVRIEWWLEESLSEKIHRFSIRSSLFEREDDFRFIDDEVAQRGEQGLRIETSQGELNLAAQVERRTEGGRKFLVLSAERTLVPMRPGRFSLPPAHVEVEEVVRWRRDFFGGRTAGETRRLLSRDVARTLEIEEPPPQNRPPSYAGAVGRGFSLDVTADRSVVQRGDPIVLSLTIRGDGNLRAVGLPELAHDEGLPPAQFRLPENLRDLPGTITDGGKVFQLKARVLDEGLREIPALAYSWFDPDRNEYQTTHSRPIALSVKPAQIVSADDVIASTPETNASDEPMSTSARAPESTHSPAFDTSGADLSIERDIATLMGREASPAPLRWAAYAIGGLLLCGAMPLRRIREADPLVKHKRALLKQQRQRVRDSGALASRARAAEIAAALRETVSAAPETAAPEIDALLQTCDELIYAPEDQPGEPAGEDLERRALALLDDAAETIQ